VRGVIEGFYGTPWAHSARLDAIEFLGERGMNAYVYAPKDDPRHRAQWREPYDAAAAAQLRELASACAAARGRFGFALSPGLDIDYGSAADRAALLAKLVPLLDSGVDWLVLALDDIPPRPKLAADQVELTNWLLDALRGRDTGVRLTLVPTEYVGTRPSDYLSDLARGLPADVDVMWTGPTVCSPRITTDDALAWQSAVGGHPLLLWDNYPVNDGVMARELHLGAYRGRDAGLADVLDGVLCNPMVQPRASLVALATAAEFLCDPVAYDEDAAWERAIAAVGGKRATSLRTLARACADGPLRESCELGAHRGVVELAAALDGPDWAAPLDALRIELEALRAAPDADPAGADAGHGDDDGDADDPIGAELAPWLEQARREADAGLAALRLCQQLRPVATWRADGSGRVAAPDAERAFMHTFGVLFTWDDARTRGDHVVCGPRFAIHPAVVQLADGRQAVDVRLAVHEDANAVDRLCRLALAAYDAWTRKPVEPLRVLADGATVDVAADGTFTTSAGAELMLLYGSDSTRLTAADGPPMFDPRLR
jgi:hyaluronoglucosaminidase